MDFTTNKSIISKTFNLVTTTNVKLSFHTLLADVPVFEKETP